MTAHRFRVVVLNNDAGKAFLNNTLRGFNVALAAWSESKKKDVTIIPDNSVSDPSEDDPIVEIDTGREYWLEELAYVFQEDIEEFDPENNVENFSTPIKNFRWNMIGRGVFAFPDSDPRSVEPENGAGFLASDTNSFIFEHSISFADEGRQPDHAEVVDKFVVGTPPGVL